MSKKPINRRMSPVIRDASQQENTMSRRRIHRPAMPPTEAREAEIPDRSPVR